MPYAVVGLAILGLAVVAFLALRFRRGPAEETVTSLVAGLEHLREMAVHQTVYKSAGPGHPRLEEWSGKYDEMMRALEAKGFSSLGLVEEFKQDGTSAGVTQWFVDGSREICGWFAVIDSAQGPWFPMLFFTELEPATFIFSNRGGASVHLAGPATVVRQFHPKDAPLDTVLEAHRHAMSRHISSRLRPVVGLEGAHAVLRRLKEHVNAWRRAQPDRELLVADLREVLGERFDYVGPAMYKRMRGEEMPT